MCETLIRGVPIQSGDKQDKVLSSMAVCCSTFRVDLSSYIMVISLRNNFIIIIIFLLVTTMNCQCSCNKYNSVLAGVSSVATLITTTSVILIGVLIVKVKRLK